MARGFLSGAIWGTVVSVVGLTTASILSPRSDVPPQPVADPVAEAPAVETAPAEVEIVIVPAEGSETTAPEPEVEPTDRTQTADAPETVAEIETPEEGLQSETTAESPPSEVSEENPEGEMTAQSPQSEPDIPDERPQPTASEPQPIVESSQPSRRPADVTTVAPDTDSPALNTPSQGDDAAPQDVATAPTPAPEVTSEAGSLQSPEMVAVSDAPAQPSTEGSPDIAQGPALASPDTEVGLAISTEPAQPPAPAVPTLERPLEPEPVTEAAPDPEPETAPEPDMETASQQPDAAPNQVGDEPDSAGDDEIAQDRPKVRRLVPDITTPDPEGDETDTAALARPSIGKPAGAFAGRDSGASTRLPTIGTDPETDVTEVQPSDEDARPPLERFAAPVGTDSDLPRMAIVLIDDGTGPLGPDTLDNFPFPVTFALDPGQPGAAERMAGYRALGYEVATLVDLPLAAQPTDVEQILAGSIAAVPESVALIEAPDSSLQDVRGNTEQATSFAAESGHGLVFMPNGLNTAQAIARRENVPAVSVLRDFDGDGQDARTKRRFLDGAAFRARQDGAAVMLGRYTPDTVSALLLWSLQDRASSVTMVPVSAILTASAD
ncbi:divergent polysaccharide deacetylase family protein [Marivita sp. S2033]|uniref:divergent polysaccharide deacetylase family protein n=1 Tax=Marivita sp. S2033 TaxID=3373187 RepID=UPI0039823591